MSSVLKQLRKVKASDRDPGALVATSRILRLEWLLQAVLEVQSLVTEANFDLDAFMQRVVDLAEDLTDAKGAVVELVDGEEMVYRCASASIGKHVGLRLQRAGSLSGLCVAQAQVLRCDDSEQDPRVDREACRKVGVRSMLCTPLFEAGRAVGVLKVMGDEPGNFDADDEHLLSLLAGALGGALGKQLVLEALKTSEATFRAAMETASIGNALVKPGGHFIKVNAALCDLLGYSEEELLANDFQSITHHADRERGVELMRRMLAGEIDRFRVEKRYYHKSGRTIWALVSVSLVRDRTGRPNYFVSQIQDISEQREVERVKNEFISVVSHELRTPLTSIRGSLGLVLGAFADALPAKAKGLLDIANNNCERLMQLIDDILDIDKIASGNMRFDMRERTLAHIMHKAVQGTEMYAQRFNVRVELNAQASDVKVSVDEDRLVQVLSNLLSNAVKFSPSGGVVGVGAQVNGDRVRLQVVDQGPGIPEEFRSRIFDKFSQADSSTTRRAGGTGLGLHISRKIVESMRGTIGFDTEIGRGTTFWVEFPLQCSSSS
jgi:PAS domain S-box-containing protein